MKIQKELDNLRKKFEKFPADKGTTSASSSSKNHLDSKATKKDSSEAKVTKSKDTFTGESSGSKNTTVGKRSRADRSDGDISNSEKPEMKRPKLKKSSRIKTQCPICLNFI